MRRVEDGVGFLLGSVSSNNFESKCWEISTIPSFQKKKVDRFYTIDQDPTT